MILHRSIMLSSCFKRGWYKFWSCNYYHCDKKSVKWWKYEILWLKNRVYLSKTDSSVKLVSTKVTNKEIQSLRLKFRYKSCHFRWFWWKYWKYCDFIERTLVTRNLVEIRRRKDIFFGKWKRRISVQNRLASEWALWNALVGRISNGLRGWGFDVFLWLVTSNSKKVIKHTSRKRNKQFDYLVDVLDG